MKHLSFIPSFVSRLVLIFAAITTLGVANSYATDYQQQGSNAGWWGTGGLIFTWNKDGESATTSLNYNGGSNMALGTISNTLTLTNTTAKFWKNGSGNICNNTEVYWELFKGTSSIESGNISPRDWTNDGGNNAHVSSSTTINFYAKASANGSGNYTIKIYAKLEGNASGTDGCYDNFWYNNNNTGTYSITFTIPTNNTIYFVNSEGWTNVYCYAWGTGNNGPFPGVAMTKTATKLCGYDVYKCTLPSTYTSCIFSKGNNDIKTRDLTIVNNGYFHYEMQRWYASSAAVTAACTSSSGAPVMTYGAAEKIYQRKAEMQVGAVDDTTPFEDLVYYCELETPMGETYKFYQITFFEHITGYFDIINLIPCQDYTLTVWAIDNDGNMSENSIAINFTTECDPSGFYLAGSMNSWNTTDNNWKFQEHTEYNNINQDRYILIKESMSAGTTYKFVTGSTWSPDGDSCNLYVDHDAEHVVFTVKANNIHKHISSLDEIYVVGPAIGDGTDGWNLTEARKLTWDNSISATWEGTVLSGAQYQLVVRTKYKCDNNSTGNYDYWIICNGNQTYNQPFTNAILTFDLLTWGWTWTNADNNLCKKTGFPPAGMTPPDFNAAKHFQMGYEISIYTPDATHLYVTAKSNDWRKKSGSATPIFMIFPQEDANLKVLEMPMVSTGTYDANGNEIFELTITQGQKANNYSTEDLVEDFTMGACIRWAVKFPYAGGFSVTDPMYYYIREGCAPYYFNIYHHDDLPGTKGDTITTFKGGEILQPIIYYRKFTPGAWETLCLPFTCSAVRVYDPDDDKEYDLLPQHNSENAEYWLRTFGPATYTERDGFKPNWQNVPVGVNLPEKDVPYIMQVPDVGGYYNDKYVMFYGKGYQTIANKTPWTKGSSADGFRYFGNTTMWPQNLGQAYMISADGLWFEKSSGNTLYPFECYVVADPTNTAKYVRFGGVGEQAPEVATGVPNVNDDQSLNYSYDGAQLYLRSTADTPVSIYSVDGRLILSSDLSAHIESAYTLVPGIYVVSTKLGIYKLAL